MPNSQKHSIFLNHVLPEDIISIVRNQTTLRSFEHKAISPKFSICKVCVLDGKNHFSPQFRAIQNLITFLTPLWTFFSKVPPICPNSKVYQNQVKLESTLLRITRLVPSKSYLVIICPNSQEMLTSKIRFEHCSESLVQVIGSHIWSHLTISHTKLELLQPESLV